MKTYKTLTQMVECTDHVEHLTGGHLHSYKKMLLWVDITPIALLKTISIAFMYQRILKWLSTSTMKTYKTVTEMVECTDHVEP